MTEGHRLPSAHATSICGTLAVNTDDVTHFIRVPIFKSKTVDIPPLSLVDEEWKAKGIRGQHRKSIDLQSNGTALGIDLVDGVWLAPHLPGFVSVVLAGTDLLRCKTASPLETNSLLGKVQWYDLLNRFLLSSLQDVYSFVREENGDEIRAVPIKVLDELALNISLFSFWAIDLTRGWLETLPVSDASGSYGFGFCMAAAPGTLVREVASLPYDSVTNGRCTEELGAPLERPRAGATFRLPVRPSQFKPVLSQRARWSAHSGGLEASAVAQGLRLMSRDTRMHGKRGVFHVDAQAVMHALRKGRSSAPTLLHPIRLCGHMLSMRLDPSIPLRANGK
jgi:hypothetical protein